MFQTYTHDLKIGKKTIEYMEQIVGYLDRHGEFKISFEIETHGDMFKISTNFDDQSANEIAFVSKIWAAGMGYYSGYTAAKAEALDPAGSF